MKNITEQILSKHIDKETMNSISVNIWPDMLEAMEEYRNQPSPDKEETQCEACLKSFEQVSGIITDPMDWPIWKRAFDAGVGYGLSNLPSHVGGDEKCTDCNGNGIIVDVRTEPRCCMNFDEGGGCCNYPIPDQIQNQRQCERCQATGHLSNLPGKEREWVSVKERKPEQRTYVMVHNHNGYDIAEYKHGLFYIGLDTVSDVTHWMPLPKAPKS